MSPSARLRILESPVLDRMVSRSPGWVKATGEAAVMTGQLLRALVTPPFNYGAEFIAEFRFAAQRAWLALMITAFAFAFGPAGVQGSGLLGLFGALDRLGGLYSIYIVREFAPLVVGIILAGVIGTAVTADLGARKVREELDALSVLSVDIVRSIVLPRFLMIVSLALFFNGFAIVAGTAGAVLVEVQYRQPLGPLFASYWAAANPVELAASYFKCFIFGMGIAIVSTYKGLSVSGGAEGVGRAVNQSVVICFLLIGSIDYLFGQLVLATNPVLSEVR
jgi:phospholipid/cholesterol/gamma-HCH transport system permease protein